MKKIILLTCSFIVIFSAGCGPSSEELAVTMVAQTDVAATQTRAAAATSTPTPTEMPTETPTHTQIPPTPTLNPQLKNYYPLRPDAVWWYTVYAGDEPIGLTSFTMLSPESDSDGSLIYPVVNRNGLAPDISHNIDYIRINDDSIELIRFLTVPKLPDTTPPEMSEIEFTPPIPFLKFPLEVGNTWERIGEGGQHSYRYEVLNKVEISVPYGDFEDCYLIERSTDGVPNFREGYCPEVGRVFFEHNSFGPWVQTARIEVTEVSKDFLNNCNYALEFHGFSEDEVLTLGAITPNTEDPQLLFEDFPISQGNITFTYQISTAESAGNYLFLVTGERQSAMYLIEYDGECQGTNDGDPTPEYIEYATPGPPPSGLPRPETSEFLQTNYGAFSISLENFTITYFLSLRVLKELPTEAYIEARFENPSNPMKPIIVTQHGPQPQKIELQSPPLTGLKKKNYWVEVVIYSNPDKEDEIGRHVQWIQSDLEFK